MERFISFADIRSFFGLRKMNVFCVTRLLFFIEGINICFTITYCTKPEPTVKNICHYYFMEYDCLLIKADTSIVFTVLLYLFVMKSFASFPEQLHLITASFLLGWYVLFIYTVIGVFDIYVGIIDLPFSDIILMELMINYSKSVNFLSLFCCRHKLGYGGE